MFELSEINIATYRRDTKGMLQGIWMRKRLAQKLFARQPQRIAQLFATLFYLRPCSTTRLLRRRRDQITINCYREMLNLLFQFLRQCIGIDEEHINRIFRTFYRVDKGVAGKSEYRLGLRC